MDPNLSPGTSPNDLDREVASIHAEYSAQLMAYGLSIARNEDAALDAVQEVLLRYFVERSYGRIIEHPKAWLYRVLRNYLLDQLAKASLRWEVAEAAEVANVADDDHGPEERLHHAQMARHLESALSPGEMECLRHRADGLEYGDIATMMGVRAGTVSSMLTRAYKKLRTIAQARRDGASGTMTALHFLLGGNSFAP